MAYLSDKIKLLKSPITLNWIEYDKRVLGAKLFLCTLLQNRSVGSSFFTIIHALALFVGILAPKDIVVSHRFYWKIIFFIYFIYLFVFEKFYKIANHQFLYLYIIAMFIAAFIPSRENPNNKELSLQEIGKCVKYILVILMFFATLQKILQPNFTQGYLFYDQWLTGDLPHYVKQFSNYITGEYFEIVEHNRYLQKSLLGQNSQYYTFTYATPKSFPHILLFFKYTARLIICTELILLLLILFRDKAIKTHIFILFFVWGFCAYRISEVTFLTLTTILSFLLCPSEYKKINYLYIITILIFTAFNQTLLYKILS